MNHKPHPLEQTSEQAILSALASYKDIRLAILFGSLATGTARADSDLDLAIDLGHKLDSGEKMQLIGDLALACGRPVDLIDIQTAGEPLLGQILQHGKRLLGSNSRYAELICRHLFEQADFLPLRNRILAERRKAWTGK